MPANPVTRYVFDLDDIDAIAVALRSAAGDLTAAAGSVRAAGATAANLPGVGPDVAAICAGVAAQLRTATTGLHADARWLAGTAGALARLDAGIWTSKKLTGAIRFVRAEHDLQHELGARDTRTRRATRIAGVAVDLFGLDVTGSKLPALARRAYRNLTAYPSIDRAAWNLRYAAAWYAVSAKDALAARRPPRADPDRPRRPGWAERVAGDGRGAGRLRRLMTYAVPGASAAALVVDVNQLATQQHRGARGVLEFSRDATSTVSSSIHLASDGLLLFGPPGAAADKLVDAGTLVTLDSAVLAADAVDYLVFDKGDDIVHAVGDGAGAVIDGAGDALDAIGGLL
ncbi:hypothetical protein F4553_000744 [Allocatelliglobosispora scoriae]|uniref:Uncharacterized protein n=1 Tax=Allocatelliglobosispora scoriae TaxID=643052 RepID=A0A841BIC4_9ACTN|nr:hypothetical protein [Allocatelliglobosispora scoriae]MBB5867365.1 hypothetical protein [Allocatelliglobosispora scoriae]